MVSALRKCDSADVLVEKATKRRKRRRRWRTVAPFHLEQ